MSPLVAVQKMSAWLRSADSSAKSADVREREKERERRTDEQKLKPQTAEDLVRCVLDGCDARNWRRGATLKREVCSLERDSREAWAALLCLSTPVL